MFHSSKAVQPLRQHKSHGSLLMHWCQKKYANTVCIYIYMYIYIYIYIYCIHGELPVFCSFLFWHNKKLLQKPAGGHLFRLFQTAASRFLSAPHPLLRRLVNAYHDDWRISFLLFGVIRIFFSKKSAEGLERVFWGKKEKDICNFTKSGGFLFSMSRKKVRPSLGKKKTFRFAVCES